MQHTYCGRTHHPSDTYWDLVYQPSRVNKTFATESSGERNHSGETVGSKRELNVNDKIQALRQEIQASSQHLQAPGERTLSHSMGMASYYVVGTSHVASASSSSTPLWVWHWVPAYCSDF